MACRTNAHHTIYWLEESAGGMARTLVVTDLNFRLSRRQRRAMAQDAGRCGLHICFLSAPADEQGVTHRPIVTLTDSGTSRESFQTRAERFARRHVHGDFRPSLEAPATKASPVWA